MAFNIRIKLTLPKDGVFRNKKWKDEIMRAMKWNSIPELKGLFEKTVFGWSEKPRFKADSFWNGDEAIVEVYPSGPAAETWKLVSAGSPPHPIPARPGGLLRFRPGYRAATSPGQLMSRRAYRSGPYVTAKIIPQHPGFQPRNFPDLIETEFYHTFVDQMQNAFNKAARG
jgi:hypothetical protein